MEASRQQPVWSDDKWEGAPVRRNMKRRGSLDHRYSVVEHHNNIINRYNIINGCLMMIRPSRIGTVQKLKIETMLIRVKILLLDETRPYPFQLKTSGDAAFEAVLEQVREVCEADGVAALLTALGSDPGAFGFQPI
jgi:hypothetical protein